MAQPVSHSKIHHVIGLTGCWSCTYNTCSFMLLIVRKHLFFFSYPYCPNLLAWVPCVGDCNDILEDVNDSELLVPSSAQVMHVTDILWCFVRTHEGAEWVLYPLAEMESLFQKLKEFSECSIFPAPYILRWMPCFNNLTRKDFLPPRKLHTNKKKVSKLAQALITELGKPF